MDARPKSELEKSFAAAQDALRAGRYAEAGKHYLAAQRPYDAAVCFQKGQSLKECLEALLQVAKTSEHYRPACVHAVRVAIMVGEPLARLSGFALHFLSAPPTSPAEASAMMEIAAALAKTDRREFARSIYQRVLAAYPADEDAKEALLALPPDRPSTGTSVAAVSAPNRYSPAKQTGNGKRLGELLIGRGLLTPQRLQLVLSADARLEHDDVALADALVANGYAKELDMLKALSELSGVPYISEGRLLGSVVPPNKKYLTVEKAERWKVVPLALVDKQLCMAMRDPRDIELIDQLRFAAGVSQVRGIFASEVSIRKGIRFLYYGEAPAADYEDRLWDQSQDTVEVTRFSDKFTGTREQEFDTQEMVLQTRAAAEGSSPSGVAPAPSSPGGLDAAGPAYRSSPSGLNAAHAPAGPPFHSSPSGLNAAHPAPRSSPSDLTPPPGRFTVDLADTHTVVDLDPGTVIAERYEIRALLGRGGTATVYRALDSELGEEVALKLFGQSQESQTMLARFKLELSLSRQLAHPNLIRLYDLGSHGAWRYLTLELLEGTDLSSKITERSGPLPVAEGLAYLEQACLGLQAAHDRGVIHRDVKPHNLFVTNDGVVKVMDFGIAKKEHAPNITVAGMIAGTPEYMSPEQINGFSTVTHLTDLYALGATAYCVFTGAPPFEHAELMAVLLAHASQAPQPPRQKNPAIPPALEAAILRLLEKDPARRFQSCGELALALRQIRESLGQAAPPKPATSARAAVARAAGGSTGKS